MASLNRCFRIYNVLHTGLHVIIGRWLLDYCGVLIAITSEVTYNLAFFVHDDAFMHHLCRVLWFQGEPVQIVCGCLTSLLVDNVLDSFTII